MVKFEAAKPKSLYPPPPSLKVFWLRHIAVRSFLLPQFFAKLANLGI